MLCQEPATVYDGEEIGSRFEQACALSLPSKYYPSFPKTHRADLELDQGATDRTPGPMSTILLRRKVLVDG